MLHKFFTSVRTRKVFAVVLGLLALLFWYMTLTVPMVSATAPALIALVLSVATYFTWPRHREKETDIAPTS